MIDGVKEAALSERVEPNAAARRMGGGERQHSDSGRLNHRLLAMQPYLRNHAVFPD
jgi:hypothetical protein